MYKCLKCNTTYDLTNEHYKYISKQVEKCSVVESIMICPGCRRKRILGGEEDLLSDDFGVMMFGRRYNSDDHSRGLKKFEGVIVEN